MPGGISEYNMGGEAGREKVNVKNSEMTLCAHQIGKVNWLRGGIRSSFTFDEAINRHTP